MEAFRLEGLSWMFPEKYSNHSQIVTPSVCPNVCQHVCPNSRFAVPQMCAPTLCPNACPNCAPILVVLCPNSRGAVSQFWWCCAPILVLAILVSFSRGFATTKIGAPLGHTTAKIGTPPHENWGTAPPELGHSTARIGTQPTENWGVQHWSSIAR